MRTENLPIKNILAIQAGLLFATIMTAAFVAYLVAAAYQIYLLNDSLVDSKEFVIWENPNSGSKELEEIIPRALHTIYENIEGSGGFWILGTVYAYSSEVDQTDADPYTSASGERVRDGMIANNCLVFGTSVVIGGKNYEVLDRMNERHGCEVFDIWHSTKEAADIFGKKELELNIL